jgi:hypothetical protein
VQILHIDRRGKCNRNCAVKLHYENAWKDEEEKKIWMALVDEVQCKSVDLALAFARVEF